MEEINITAGGGGLEMFHNRLVKNKKELGKFAKRNNLDCYRIYDKDVPQVPVAIDCYSGNYILQYFRGPYDLDDQIMDARIQSIEKVILEVLKIQPSQLYTKLRERKKGNSQYNKLSQDHRTIFVNEGKAKFKIILSDYLDVGLFLDHRHLREKIFKSTNNQSLLNLFCYTGAFSIQAALGGSISTTSVDVSPTYIDWAKENLDLNGLDTKQNKLICADIFDWIEDELQNKNHAKYDRIVLDPPTFSNHKKKENVFDLQRDHTYIIMILMENFLNKKGILYFSTNFRKFKLDENLEKHFQILDITKESIPNDFRDPKIHKCWQIQLRLESTE
jgi:23S rRNA (cytosine1962-C5)-methyltransferase